MYAKKPRRSPLCLRFLTYLLKEISYAVCITYFPTIPYRNPDYDMMIFKGNISYYILLLKSLITLENTKFIAGELSLIVSLVLYLPTGHYEL